MDQGVVSRLLGARSHSIDHDVRQGVPPLPPGSHSLSVVLQLPVPRPRHLRVFSLTKTLINPLGTNQNIIINNRTIHLWLLITYLTVFQETEMQINRPTKMQMYAYLENESVFPEQFLDFEVTLPSWIRSDYASI